MHLDNMQKKVVSDQIDTMILISNKLKLQVKLYKHFTSSLTKE